MNEHQFARQVTGALDHTLTELPPAVLERLHAVRREALDQQRPHVAALSLAGVGRTVSDVWFSQRRALLATCALLAALAVVNTWTDDAQISEQEEVDSALLADDLPIDAYLDHGFTRWLKPDTGTPSSR